MQFDKEYIANNQEQLFSASDYKGQDYFADNQQHLLAELERIDLIIQHYLFIVQNTFDQTDHYRGLYITDADIHNQFEKAIGEPWWAFLEASKNEDGIDLLLSSSTRLADTIEQKKSFSIDNSIELHLARLQQIYDLDREEIDIILLALATEIDLRYELIYAYLQDDITKKYPCLDLILNILGRNTRGKFRIRKYFASDAKLITQQLVELADEPSRSYSGQLSKVVSLPKRIVDFLLGYASIDTSIQNFVDLVETSNTNFYLDHDLKSKLTWLRVNSLSKNNNSVVYLQGRPGSGKQQLANFLASKQGLKLLKVNLNLLLETGINQLENNLSLIARESLLHKAAIYIYSADAILHGEIIEQQHTLLDFCNMVNTLVVMVGLETIPAHLASFINNYYHFKIPDLAVKTRAEIWQSHLVSNNNTIAENEIVELADRFNFTQGQIASAVKTASQQAAIDGKARSQLRLEDLYLACRLNTNRNLGKLAKHIQPKYDWSDITLEDDTLQQLRELHNTVRHHAKVLEDWGFDQKLSIGKGVNALFSGPPGTGKTMSAEIIAKSLGLELYKIDLSLIVSKYIGETEKNLARIFAEAETSNAILFFDEADALFGKRTEVKNSHDRYANVEVAYLLQKMEDYTGITIMATNLRRNMDEAFIRRLAFIIDFPFPEVSERQQIWKNIWPSLTPLSNEIDYEFMARNFKLSGGNIKNIALAASFLAAEGGEKVGMKQLLAATRREFEKQGRTFVRNDYGKYSNLLDEV